MADGEERRPTRNPSPASVARRRQRLGDQLEHARAVLDRVAEVALHEAGERCAGTAATSGTSAPYYARIASICSGERPSSGFSNLIRIASPGSAAAG